MKLNSLSRSERVPNNIVPFVPRRRDAMRISNEPADAANLARRIHAHPQAHQYLTPRVTAIAAGALPSATCVARIRKIAAALGIVAATKTIGAAS